MMRVIHGAGALLLAGLPALGVASDQAATRPPAAGPSAATPAAPAPLRLPYVYTKWKHFTTENGLPNDHVFAIRSNGNDLWIGTENGLALVDKSQEKVVRVWKEEDGLPFRSIAGIDVDKRTGDVWLGLFGGGLARLSAGRFDHWHQLNSGLVNDVVYDVVVENENVWCATTAGASRYSTRTGEWWIFTEKNSPMEEIWNYAVDYDPKANKIFLAIWGTGVLEYDLASNRWQEYTDPDGEMEIDLYRDDGVNHVITTGANSVDGALWVSSYFGGTRYDGRSWRGFPDIEEGLPSLFNNNVRGRSAQEAWYCSDKGAGAIVDLDPETWVQYTRVDRERGRAVVKQRLRPEDETLTTVEVIETGVNVPHSFIVNADYEGDDVFIATSHGVGWGIGEGYYPRLKERPLIGKAPQGDPAEQAPAVAKAIR
jgi:ligand-binding sensor domain-containing protein